MTDDERRAFCEGFRVGVERSILATDPLFVIAARSVGELRARRPGEAERRDRLALDVAADMRHLRFDASDRAAEFSELERELWGAA
jgi:hypothetical protein